MEAKRMVIFDFDGVLADSWELTHRTSKKMYPHLTPEVHRDGFEGNIYDAEKVYDLREKNEFDYFEEYEKDLHTVRFFDVESVVRTLAAKHLLSIVSSSPNRIIKHFLEREGLMQHFGDILGCDVDKNKHTKILMLFERHLISAADCVMVTDTVGDVREARKAGVDSIAVSWGFHEPNRFDKVETYRIVHKPEELVPAIEEYFSR